MRRIIFILGGCVLLSLLGITPFQAMAVKDSTKNMDAYWIYKIQSHEKILASHNEYVPDRMVYDVQSQSMFVMNPAKKTIDVIRKVGERDTIMEFAKFNNYAGSPKAMAFGGGILSVLIGKEHSLDTLVCLTAEGVFIRSFGLDSLMQGVFYNVHNEELVVWSMVPQGYTLQTLNLKDAPKDLADLEMVTHKTFTTPVVAETAAEKIQRMDPNGLAMTLLALIIVGIALILLYIIFKFVANIYAEDLRKRFIKKKGKSAEELSLPDIHNTTNELGAAIGLALYFYKNQLHDNENTILTINKATKNYSPWSSKIYGIRKPLK